MGNHFSSTNALTIGAPSLFAIFRCRAQSATSLATTVCLFVAISVTSQIQHCLALQKITYHCSALLGIAVFSIHMKCKAVRILSKYLILDCIVSFAQHLRTEVFSVLFILECNSKAFFQLFPQ